MTLMLAVVSGGCMTSKAENLRLPSLCDEWNVLGHAVPCGYSLYSNIKYRLTTDTIINGISYVQLTRDGIYEGAMREDNNRTIYYFPKNATHEYLLYAFNAKINDTFSNVWYGGRAASRFPEGSDIVIISISDTNPRVFTFSVHNEQYEEEMYDYKEYWVEGVGLRGGPCGNECPYPLEGDYGTTLLCAYKNGEHIYTSQQGEIVGCEAIPIHNSALLEGTWEVYKEDLTITSWDTGEKVEETQTYDVNDGVTYTFKNDTLQILSPTDNIYPLKCRLTYLTSTTSMLSFTNSNRFFTIYKLTPDEMEWTMLTHYALYTHYQYLRHVKNIASDTVPIYRYTGDDPGSSTVDPVDPNQVVVTLKGDELTIRESSGDEINFMLTNTSVASSAARAPKIDDAQSFRNEVSVQLTEDG
ncbi:MAG: hypothetical protein IKR52_04555, partial [Paludibacteraceae bacterium]|nr:hypothetical protein [Paludibacteraceae bacterium]